MTINTSEKALQLLDLADPLEIADAIEEDLTVTHQPGVMARIRSETYTKMDLTILLQPDGTILSEEDHLTKGHITLPNPALMGKKTPEKTLGIQSLLRATIVLNITRIITQKHGITDRNAHWPMDAAITQWTKDMKRHLSRRIKGMTRYTEMEYAVRQLVDQQTWAIAQDIRRKSYLNRYNRAIIGTEAIQKLNDTNPGVSAWMLTQDRPQAQALQHPGQIIQKVRNQAAKAGVETRYWKTLTRMDQETAAVLLTKYFPQYAVGIIINACGDVDVQLDAQRAKDATMVLSSCKRKSAVIGPPRRNEEPIAVRARERLRHIIRLIVKERGPDQSIQQDWTTVSHISDYAVSLIDADQNITSQTYNGLLKASQTWHQAERQNRLALQIQEEIDKQEGWFKCWNSLVDTLQIPDPHIPNVRAVPLTNTLDLLAEGKQMDHCVGAYSNSCTSGQSRIFSIRQDEAILATTELVLRNSRWQPIQTKAKHNHPPSDTAVHAAKTVAQAYQEHWKEQSGQEHRHTTWLQHPVTGETKQHLPAKSR